MLDPMSGVGTIPLEARLQGRVGLAGDLSPLAAVVSRAKLEPITTEEVEDVFESLSSSVLSWNSNQPIVPEFGLNGPISSYFHKQTMVEILLARAHFIGISNVRPLSAAECVVLTALLHILHGNRPYALSRRSHPLTPYAPSGDFEYKNVLAAVRRRLDTTVPLLSDLAGTSPGGMAVQADFRQAGPYFGTVDAVITSPPFADSFRFWSTNWMRLWLSGWEPSDFASQPGKFLEAEQARSYEPYRAFSNSMASVLKPGGALILHLGETATSKMTEEVGPMLEEHFMVDFVGRESVVGGETHGMRDAGATRAHWYLFARRR